MKDHRFPLPVSHARAPLVWRHSTALLFALLCFEVGVFAGAILFGEALLTLHCSETRNVQIHENK